MAISAELQTLINGAVGGGVVVLIKAFFDKWYGTRLDRKSDKIRRREEIRATAMKEITYGLHNFHGAVLVCVQDNFVCGEDEEARKACFRVMNNATRECHTLISKQYSFVDKSDTLLITTMLKDFRDFEDASFHFNNEMGHDFSDVRNHIQKWNKFLDPKIEKIEDRFRAHYGFQN